ncbi:F-box protein [Rhynchospora pubera]|uniref:F-box protein n=1 Tax=Rhynchospora pubera TaxID=906938 RepID=A0AAV8DXV3_9POAL|nr:F-box protein [Rhynchospora pubera]
MESDKQENNNNNNNAVGSDTANLPEECVAIMVSLTSPRDACRLSAVSSTFRSAAESDVVWARFLPSDYISLLSRAVHPVRYASKRELFFLLSGRHILIDRGKMSFGLEKSSGARCYMLSARTLSIVWGDTPQYWRWISLPDSRFSEVAELINVHWLEIRGKIQCKLLSDKTKYAAYLVYKINGHGSRSFSFQPQETAVIVGDHISNHTVSLANKDETCRNTIMFRNFLRWRGVLTLPYIEDEDNDVFDDADDADDDETVDIAGSSHLRIDGWMEVELGEFYNNEGENSEVEMSFMEVKGRHWKRGLLVQGIEIRPKF